SAHRILIVLFVLCVLAIGAWTLATWAFAAGTSLPASAQLSEPPHGAETSQSPVAPVCGPNWAVTSSPNVGTYDSFLYGVAAVSSSDAWAVGDYHNTIDAVFRTLVERWNGSTWSIVSSPNGDTQENVLNSVAAISGSDVWAVGYYNNGIT